MNYAAIALTVLAIVATFYTVRFFRREAEKDRALLALFTPGTVVARGERRYAVLEIDLGFATLQSIDEGEIRIVDLMTGAGTYRNTMTENWVRVGPN